MNLAHTPYTLQNVQEAVRVLHAGKSSGSVSAFGTGDEALQVGEHRQVQSWLESFQRSQEAWTVIPQLMASISPEHKFFAAHTCQIKLSREWNQIPARDHEALCRQLASWVVENCNGPAFVLNKLCVALVTYCLRCPSYLWGNVIDDLNHLLLDVAAREHVDMRSVLVHVLTILVEEISTSPQAGDNALVAQVRSSGTKLASWLSDAMQSSSNAELVNRGLACLECLLLHNYIAFGPLNTLLPSVIRCLDSEETFDAAIACIDQLLSWEIVDRHEPRIWELLLPVLTSDETRARLSHDLVHVARQYVRIFTTFGECFQETLTDTFTEPPTVKFFEAMLWFTSFPGQIGVDQEVADIPLVFWSYIQENLSDRGFFSEDREFRDRDLVASGRLADTREAAKSLYLRLLDELLRQSQFPEKYENDNTEDGHRFRVYRRDIGDTILVTYYALRGDCVERIMQFFNESLASFVESGAQHWRGIESALFGVRAISEEFSDLDLGPFRGLMQQLSLPTAPLPVARALLKLMAELPDRFGTDFSNSVSFAETWVNHCVLSDSAMHVICRLCQSVDAVEETDLVRLCNAYRKLKLSLLDSGQLIQGIASLLSTNIPANAWVLDALVTDVVTDLWPLVLQSQERQDLSPQVRRSYDRLSSIARGVDPSYIDVSEAKALGMPEHATTRTVAARFLQAVWPLVDNTCRRFQSDDNVIQAVVGFLSTTIQNGSPIFAYWWWEPAENPPLVDAFVTLLTREYPGAPRACWLDCITGYIVQSHSRKSRGIPPPDAESKMTSLIVPICQETVRAYPSLDTYPELLSSLMSMMGKCLRFHKDNKAFGRESGSLMEGMLNFGTTLLGTGERFTLKAALQFLTQFVGSNAEICAEVLQSHNHIAALCDAIVRGIERTIPRSLLAEVASLIYKLVQKVPALSLGAFEESVNRPSYPTARLAPEERRVLMNALTPPLSIRKITFGLNRWVKSIWGYLDEEVIT